MTKPNSHNSAAAFLFSGRTLHTIRQDGGWVNRRENSERSSPVYFTQQEAIAQARIIARRERITHVTHDSAGQVCERVNYDYEHSYDYCGDESVLDSARFIARVDSVDWDVTDAVMKLVRGVRDHFDGGYRNDALRKEWDSFRTLIQTIEEAR